MSAHTSTECLFDIQAYLCNFVLHFRVTASGSRQVIPENPPRWILYLSLLRDKHRRLMAAITLSASGIRKSPHGHRADITRICWAVTANFLRPGWYLLPFSHTPSTGDRG
jgi:hypothetical protein